MCLSEAAARRYDAAICRGCAKDGCSLDTSDTNVLVLDADEHSRIDAVEGRIPDYYIFFVAPPPATVVLELKSGRLDAKEAIEQLRGGAKQAEELLEGTRASFLPLVLFGRGGQAAEFKILRRLKVRFQGRDHPVVGKRCGARLTDLLRYFG